MGVDVGVTLKVLYNVITETEIVGLGGPPGRFRLFYLVINLIVVIKRIGFKIDSLLIVEVIDDGVLYYRVDMGYSIRLLLHDNRADCSGLIVSHIFH